MEMYGPQSVYCCKQIKQEKIPQTIQQPLTVMSSAGHMFWYE